MLGPFILVPIKKLLDQNYIYPGGVHEGMPSIICWKVDFVKHTNKGSPKEMSLKDLTDTNQIEDKYSVKQEYVFNSNCLSCLRFQKKCFSENLHRSWDDWLHHLALLVWWLVPRQSSSTLDEIFYIWSWLPTECRQLNQNYGVPEEISMSPSVQTHLNDLI